MKPNNEADLYMIENDRTNHRIIFLDNLRLFMVLSVVMFHSSNAYSKLSPSWTVHDPLTSGLFNYLILILDLFQIPVLFFITGFFAREAIEKRGVTKFILLKFKRLIIPLFLIGLFLQPVVSYIGYQNRSSLNISYFEFWKHQLSGILNFNFIHLSSVKITQLHQNDFSLMHLWFLSLLFLFCCVFAFVYQILLIKIKHSNKDNIPTIKIFFIYLLFVIIGSLILHQFFSTWVWVKFGALLYFQPVRIPLYISFFILGIFYYDSQIKLNIFSRKYYIWGIIGIFLTFILFKNGRFFFSTKNQSDILIVFLHVSIRAIIAGSFLFFFLNFFKAFLNRPILVLDYLSNSSYTIYLLHYVIVVIFQLAILNLNISVFLKFFLVFSLTTLTCSAIGHFIVNRSTYFASFLLLISFFITCFVL